MTGGLLITYRYEGDDAKWADAVRTFIDHIHRDPKLAGRFSYEVVRSKQDPAQRTHLPRWDSDETLKHVQSQDWFKAFAAQVREFAGDSLQTTPIAPVFDSRTKAAAGSLLYEDEMGQILRHGDANVLEIRWFDRTAAIDGEGFNAWLSTFAAHVETYRPTGVLTDAMQFRMDLKKVCVGWREAHIVPRYNAAGLQKFAFHMPAGMPAIGTEPAREASAQYLTGYFGSRADALRWLGA